MIWDHIMTQHLPCIVTMLAKIPAGIYNFWEGRISNLVDF